MSLGGDVSHHSFQLSSHKLDGRNNLEWPQSVKLVIDGREKLGHLTGKELDQCYSDEWDCIADRIYLFLAGLNRVFDVVRSRVLGKKPLPTLREAFLEVRREETRRKVVLKSYSNMKPSPENSALATIHDELESGKKKKLWRNHCKKHWHRLDTCWKIHGKPPNWKKKSTTDNRPFQATKEEQGQQDTSEMPPFMKE
ncbi:hypothetical protein ACH5RR_012863 [Cinchona calisaya]|uniref:Uncharacterized protein n=1 Tax=Cinchona calisaya TaxID=153742 RepID=A0ABD3A923_9GENT